MPYIDPKDLERLKRREFCKGVREGKARTLLMRKQMITTNVHLWKLLNLFDKYYPITGVPVNPALADKIVKALRTRGRWELRPALAKQLEQAIKDWNVKLAASVKEQQSEVLDALDKG